MTLLYKLEPSESWKLKSFCRKHDEKARNRVISFLYQAFTELFLDADAKQRYFCNSSILNTIVNDAPTERLVGLNSEYVQFFVSEQMRRIIFERISEAFHLAALIHLPSPFKPYTTSGRRLKHSRESRFVEYDVILELLFQTPPVLIVLFKK